MTAGAVGRELLSLIGAGGSQVSISQGLEPLDFLAPPAAGGATALRMDNLGTPVGGFFFLVASLLLITDAKEPGT